MPILEPNVYALIAAKQTARNSPVALNSLTRRYLQVTGGMAINRDDGKEDYGDVPVSGTPASSKYGSSTDWVNSLLGQGEPGIEATPTELAHLLWLFHGAETVTTITGPPAAAKHTFTPQLNRGHYFTLFERVGASVITRRKHNDCLIDRVQIEGSTANKAVRITPRIISLDPGENQTADPTVIPALPADRPFLYTDGVGSFTIDGVVVNGHSQFSLVIDDAWTPVFGDDVIPLDLVQGNPVVTIACTMHFDANALAEYNRIVYGTATPAIGARPSKNVAALGSYSFDLKQRDAAGNLTGREFKLTLPGVKWAPPAAPGPNPAGGGTELAISGEMRPVTGQQPYTIDVNTASADTAFTV